MTLLFKLAHQTRLRRTKKSKKTPLVRSQNPLRQQSPKQRKGGYFEQRALQYLKTQGLELIAHNVHNRYGEIDLIMYDQAAVVFVEVRYRRANALCDALSSISLQKQRRTLLTAQYWLMNPNLGYSLANRRCRFDIVAFNGNTMSWIQQAFDSSIAL